MTLRFSLRNSVLFTSLVVLFGCNPKIIFTAPDLASLIYDSEFNLRMLQGASSVTQFRVAGIRNYVDLAGDQTHAFSMDDAADKMTFVIYDANGVAPGTGTFSYELQLVDKALNPIWTRKITLQVPATGVSERVKRFSFEFSTGPDGAPQISGNELRQGLNYPIGLPVGGRFQITSPDAFGRDVIFNIKYSLSDQVRFIRAQPIAELPTP